MVLISHPTTLWNRERDDSGSGGPIREEKLPGYQEKANHPNMTRRAAILALFEIIERGSRPRGESG